MAYTALTLITRSYYLSQIVSRNLQTVTGDQITDGLYLLNALLDIKGSDIRLIPYYTEYFFNSVQGQEEYFVPNLLGVDSLTFNIGTVRYPMRQLSRDEYFSTGRIDNIQSLPFSYRVERCLDGANVFLYFVPADIYQMKLWGKFGLADVTLDTDLSTIYDGFYIEYLRYALGEYICCEYGITFPNESMRKYDEIRKKLMDTSPADLKTQKRSYFSRGPVFDWQMVNIPGWLP